MALRVKVLLIVGGALAGLIIVLYLISQSLMLNSYLNLEDQDVHRNVQRAINTLQGETDTLRTTTADWAYWDDTYVFAQGGDPDYITANFTDSTFSTLKLNLILLFDNQGTMLYGQGFDLDTSLPVDIPASLSPYIEAKGALMASSEAMDAAGLIVLDGAPMFVSSRAILTSGKAGPVGGTLIFGRWLDAAKIEQMAQATQLSLAVRSLDDPQSPSDFQAARAALSQAETVVQPFDQAWVNGYTTLKDINGTPALYLKVQLDRAIYAQGQTSLSTFILGVLLVGVVMIAVTLVLIERLVLARLVYLSAQMETVTASGDPGARVTVDGVDELGLLGTDINKMLTAIEQAQLTVRQNKERLQLSLNELEKSQKELMDNDHQLQMTVSRLESQKRQFQRMYEFVRSTIEHMNSSLQHGAPLEEIMQYLNTVQTQFTQIDKESGEK